MIVKILIRKEKADFSIWNEAGDRLYYSDKPKDLELAINLCHPVNHAYFNACWLNKVVQIKKRTYGYTW